MIRPAIDLTSPVNAALMNQWEDVVQSEASFGGSLQHAMQPRYVMKEPSSFMDPNELCRQAPFRPEHTLIPSVYERTRATLPAISLYFNIQAILIKM